MSDAANNASLQGSPTADGGDDTGSSASVCFNDLDPTPAARACGVAVSRALRSAAVLAELGTVSGSCTVTSSRGDARLAIHAGRVTVSNIAPGTAGEPDDPDVASWARHLERPALTWTDAADHFWAVLERLPGAPEALLVSTADGSEERRFGRADGTAYALHAAPEVLARVLLGDVLLIDAVADGTVKVDGNLPHMSVLCGAGMEISIGEWR